MLIWLYKLIHKINLNTSCRRRYTYEYFTAVKQVAESRPMEKLFFQEAFRNILLIILCIKIYIVIPKQYNCKKHLVAKSSEKFKKC